MVSQTLFCRWILFFLLSVLVMYVGQIVDAKDRRDQAKKSKATLTAKILAGSILLLLAAGFLLYIYLFAMRQTVDRQSGWFKSFVVWLLFEIFVVSSLMVLVQHVIVPSLAMRDVRKVKKKVANDIATFKNTATTRAHDPIQSARQTPNVSRTSKPQSIHRMSSTGKSTLNAAKYFYIACRVARLFPDVPESGMVAHFSTPWPKKSMNRHDKTMSKVYGRKFTFIGQAVSRIVLYMLVGLFQMPPIMQDAIVQIVLASGFGYVVALLVQLYLLSPLLMLVPVVGAAIIVHFAIAATKRPEVEELKRLQRRDHLVHPILDTAPEKHENTSDETTSFFNHEHTTVLREVRATISRIHPLSDMSLSLEQDDGEKDELAHTDPIKRARLTVLRDLRASLNQVHPSTVPSASTLGPSSIQSARETESLKMKRSKSRGRRNKKSPKNSHNIQVSQRLKRTNRKTRFNGCLLQPEADGYEASDTESNEESTSKHFSRVACVDSSDEDAPMTPMRLAPAKNIPPQNASRACTSAESTRIAKDQDREDTRVALAALHEKKKELQQRIQKTLCAKIASNLVDMSIKTATPLSVDELVRLRLERKKHASTLAQGALSTGLSVVSGAHSFNPVDSLDGCVHDGASESEEWKHRYVSLSTDVAREFRESQRVIAMLQKKLKALEKTAEKSKKTADEQTQQCDESSQPLVAKYDEYISERAAEEAGQLRDSSQEASRDSQYASHEKAPLIPSTQVAINKYPTHVDVLESPCAATAEDVDDSIDEIFLGNEDADVAHHIMDYFFNVNDVDLDRDKLLRSTIDQQLGRTIDETQTSSVARPVIHRKQAFPEEPQLRHLTVSTFDGNYISVAPGLSTIQIPVTGKGSRIPYTGNLSKDTPGNISEDTIEDVVERDDVIIAEVSVDDETEKYGGVQYYALDEVMPELLRVLRDAEAEEFS